MFVCPKCGFKDKPCWRAHRYMLYVVYCRIDELEQFRPDLVAKLRVYTDIEDGPYAYHLTSSGYVLRTTIELKAFMYKRDLIQKYVAATLPGQQRLQLESQRRERVEVPST